MSGWQVCYMNGIVSGGFETCKATLKMCPGGQPVVLLNWSGDFLPIPKQS